MKGLEGEKEGGREEVRELGSEGERDRRKGVHAVLNMYRYLIQMAQVFSRNLTGRTVERASGDCCGSRWLLSGRRLGWERPVHS